MEFRIFLNYRRADSSHVSGRIHDRLAAAFGAGGVMLDVQSMPYGENFEEFLNRTVSSCDAMIVVIGAQWLAELKARRESGERDFVAAEIAAALKRDILVAPVLVDGASMPAKADLPARLKPLTRRNAATVSHATFDGDIAALILRLRASLMEKNKSKLAAADPDAHAGRDEWLVYEAAFLLHDLEPPSIEAHFHLMTPAVSETKDDLHRRITDGLLPASRTVVAPDGVTVLRRYIVRQALQDYARAVGLAPGFLAGDRTAQDESGG